MTTHETIEKILAKPPRTFTKEEADELFLHLGVIDESGEIREPFKDVFVRKRCTNEYNLSFIL